MKRTFRKEVLLRRKHTIHKKDHHKVVGFGYVEPTPGFAQCALLRIRYNSVSKSDKWQQAQPAPKQIPLTPPLLFENYGALKSSFPDNFGAVAIVCPAAGGLGKRK